MTDFIAFCQSHGLIINQLPTFGKWTRVPTENHPRKKNGAAKYLGDVGFCQDHATMTEPAVWFTDKDSPVDLAKITRMRNDATRQMEQDARKAADKAQWIIDQCQPEQHAYLESKGFPDMQGLVWRPEEHSNLLVIPMRNGADLVGCQLIDRAGHKKFLFGQRSGGAEFVIGSSGVDVWVEGYATGLSVSKCAKHAGLRLRTHICFSAGNLQKMAKSGYVIADNDASGTGVKAAQATKLPFWVSDHAGEDFNDFWKRTGTVRASLELRKGIILAQRLTM